MRRACFRRRYPILRATHRNLCIIAFVVIGHSPCAIAGEADILALLKSFFEMTDAPQRSNLAARIKAHPSYDMGKVGVWLHRVDLFKPFKPGNRAIRVPIDTGERRTVRIRIPKGYDPGRPWPLIIAYHGSGGSGREFIRYVEGLLGPKIDDFLVAAPHHYRHTVVDLPGPASNQNPAVWHAIRKTVHVDSDRVYVLGYSLGGYATWTYATLHADQFAGAVPIASTFGIPPEGNLWEAFVANFAHLPVLFVWGDNDRLAVPGFGGRRARHDIAELNQRFTALASRRELGVTTHAVPRGGHGGIIPPPKKLEELLTRRRVTYPDTVDHTFRHLYQATAYWLEGQTWVGAHWDAAFHQQVIDRLNADENELEVMESVRSRLGRLHGKVEGQHVSVHRRHIGNLTVWFGEDMIDWSKPVSVTVDGKTVFEGALNPDLLVCLSQAARTHDFDRLRWAGLSVRGDVATVVTEPNNASP